MIGSYLVIPYSYSTLPAPAQPDSKRARHTAYIKVFLCGGGVGGICPPRPSPAYRLLYTHTRVKTPSAAIFPSLAPHT